MADVSTAQNSDFEKNSQSFEVLLTKKPKTKEEAVRVLKDFKNSGNFGIKDLLKSPLWKAVNDLSGGLKYMSIDAVISDFQKKEVKDSSKIEINQEKKDQQIKSEENKKETKGDRQDRQKKEKDKRNIKAEERINQKIDELSKKSAKDLGGDENLEKIIKDETGAIIRNGNIKPPQELNQELSKKIADNLGKDVDGGIRVKSEEIIKEAESLEKSNPKLVQEYRRESLKREIESEYRKANEGVEISSNQKTLIKNQAELVANTFYGGREIEVDDRNAIVAGAVWMGTAKLNLAYRDFEGTAKLLQKTPNQIKSINEKFLFIKNGLSGLNQPNGISELTSFNNLMGALSNGGVMQTFNFGQSGIMSWADRINTWTGGAMSRAFSNWGGQFISKIGNESIRAFAENGLKMFAEKGFQGGFNAIMQGVLSNGARMAATGAATAGAAGAAGAAGTAVGAASGPWGWVAMAAIALLKGLKKLGQKIKDGINNLVAGGRGEDEDINNITKKKWFKLLIILAILMYGCGIQNQASTLVQPTEKEENLNEEPSTPIGGFGDSSDNIACDPRTEDLGVYENAHYKGKQIKIRLCIVPNITTFRKADPTADPQQRRVVIVNSRVSGAFYQMAADALKDGIQLQAGYSFRTYEMQKEISIKNCGHIRGCSGVAGAGKSNHEAGLAIDLAKWLGSNSITNKWLVNNANKYNIYRIASEFWHWQAEE